MKYVVKEAIAPSPKGREFGMVYVWQVKHESLPITRWLVDATCESKDTADKIAAALNAFPGDK